jgi:hypothetical protein
MHFPGNAVDHLLQMPDIIIPADSLCRFLPLPLPFLSLEER